MWTPLPQVLERAINEIYRDKGWDAIHGENERARMSDSDSNSVWHPFAHPTLTDLYGKISELVPRLGYDKEVERNVRTALETRLNSLRIGAKGLMLDCRVSTPIEYLLAGPTVLELEGIGDDDEKAFIMGLILIKLFEYYRQKKSVENPGLRHITIIEEAHRLLSASAQAHDTESTNLKSKAVETFTNMLSEIRAYGEGFIVAEQIPTKLAVDVIKNTGLKIMHRTVSLDDRQVMGGAMNLDEAQLRQVSSLRVGQAVVHGGGKFGDDAPMLVDVTEVKEAQNQQPQRPDEPIRAGWNQFVERYPDMASSFKMYPTCLQYCQSLPNEKDGDRLTCLHARQMAEEVSLRDVFASLVLSLVARGLQVGGDELSLSFLRYCQPLHQTVSSLITLTKASMTQRRCLLTHALYLFMGFQGWRYGWDYQTEENLSRILLPILLESLKNTAPDQTVLQGLKAFSKLYSELCVLSYNPYPECEHVCSCGQGEMGRLCLFRHAVTTLVRSVEFMDAYKDAQSDPAKLLARGYRFANRLSQLTETSPGFRSVALCFVIQGVHGDRTMDRVSRSNLLSEVLGLYPQGGSPSF